MSLENMVKVKIKKLHPDAKLPSYAKYGDAGMDVYSVGDAVIKAGERASIPTGLSMQLPPGHVCLVWDKSGLAANQGLKTMAGVIDHTFRGECNIVVYNTSKEDYLIKKGQKIAQLLIQPIITAELEEVAELDESVRGANGFGSTGNF